MKMLDADFARANSAFAKRYGTPPPVKVFEIHPAFGPLAEAIRQAMKKQRRGYRFRCRHIRDRWCDEAATYVLADLARDADRLTAGGVTSEELAEDHDGNFDMVKKGCNAAVTRIVIALLDDTQPTDDGPLLAAWQAIRAFPAPDLCDRREPGPQPYDYLAEVRARHAELKARSARHA